MHRFVLTPEDLDPIPAAKSVGASETMRSEEDPLHRESHVTFPHDIPTQAQRKPRSMSVLPRPRSHEHHSLQAEGISSSAARKSFFRKSILQENCSSSGDASPRSVHSVASEPRGSVERNERTNKLLEGLAARFKSPLQQSQVARRGTMIDRLVHLL